MTNQRFTSAYDVIIVGARVAGAATAMLLASAGLRVLAIDKGRYGSDTLSTHALMRPAAILLRQWGLLDRLEQAGTPPVRRTTFWYSHGDRRKIIPIDLEPRHGVAALYAPRRTVLDPILVDAAREAGAEVRHGVRFVDVLRRKDGRVCGVLVRDDRRGERAIRARLVIGADGRHSHVARRLRAAPYVVGRNGTSTAYGYFRRLPVDGNRWYFRPGSGAGAIPTNHGQTLVFASIPEEAASSSPSQIRRVFASTLSACAPDIAARLGDAELAGKMWTFPGMRGFLRQAHGPGWALVGDAGYMSDPITAHGITNALRDAVLLSRSLVERRSLEVYQATRDDLSHTFFELSDHIASLDWDLATVERYHRQMSEEMSREEQFLLNMRLASDTRLLSRGYDERRESSSPGT